MKKRIIVLVDFSEYSENLLKYASDWGSKVDVELVLVHQNNVLVPALADIQDRNKIIRNSNAEAFDKLRGFVKPIISSTLEVSYLASELDLQEILEKLLSEPYHNMILLGTKNAGILKKIFLGSKAVHIIDKIKNSVVVLPGEIDSFSVNRIFVAVKQKYPLNILELNHFLKFVNEKETQIVFFYIAKPEENVEEHKRNLEKLVELYAENYQADYAIYESNVPSEGIKKVINNNETEILVLQKGNRFVTDHIFRKFLVNELVYVGDIPLVVLP
ncbi:universal stress protein [Riemerella anatipestifer]|uniref:Universal stress protein n=2 Tax=Riemerella anatipestifer TaxID=34085 RepID=A0AAP3AL83_RIEAN|nr:universal stress protein [Riemerella anatipestifer]AZZ59601.1 universal stress protein [Riemerella anatipestifer]MBT0525524.1 universal stress protein [Riemerella anatipestifer]MBT0527367.1 universal stress protein [Riemerella anatipestifer]MBT0529408.1 universal stress protein [Riemerella anatipestifer]MBT0531209.1 universal stress protein [Riemerella anatipestifer]